MPAAIQRRMVFTDTDIASAASAKLRYTGTLRRSDIAAPPVLGSCLVREHSDLVHLVPSFTSPAVWSVGVRGNVVLGRADVCVLVCHFVARGGQPFPRDGNHQLPSWVGPRFEASAVGARARVRICSPVGPNNDSPANDEEATPQMHLPRLRDQLLALLGLRARYFVLDGSPGAHLPPQLRLGRDAGHVPDSIAANRSSVGALTWMASTNL